MVVKICSKCGLEKTKFHKHKSRRDGLDSICKDCKREYDQQYHLENRDKRLADTKRWQSENPEKTIEYSIKSRVANGHNRVKRSRLWRKNNPDKRNAQCAKHRAHRIKATPPWLTDLHFQQMKIFYDAATRLTKEFGIAMHVDHIVPLNGKEICGLHVPWNLQVLPATDNLKKSNALMGDKND